LDAGLAATLCLASASCALLDALAAVFGFAAAFDAGFAARFDGAFFATGFAGLPAGFTDDLTLGLVTALGADFGTAVFGFAFTAGVFPFALGDAFETALDATLVAIWLCAP
jgi:hypothetical protein